MKNAKLKLLGVLMVLVLLMSACGSKGSDLVGTWATDMIHGAEMAFSFESNGKCSITMDGESFTGKYTVKGDQVTMTMEGEDEDNVFTYKVDGDELTISTTGIDTVLTKK